ncbi:ROK family protein [Jiangella rhizosphaerae]|uniref:ROK family protein n=2 Tax=Jiangella rhizosphaerae TaxID=2293569 RepID=A0A418KMS7_9ACTN|nr:ROK family protein [Jiangella rhizosphaerae]
MALALAEPDGTIVARHRLPTNAGDGAERALSRALDAAEKLVSDSGRPVLAAGVATPGVVRPDGIDLAPNVPGWGELRLADALRDRLGDIPVPVWNDVNAAALAETRHGSLRTADPGLVLGLGTGVAAAVTVGGQVVPGFHGAAGEIGYTLVGSGLLHPDEAHLEAVFGGRVLDDLAAAHGLTGGAPALLADADPELSDLADRRIDSLTRAVIAMCLLLDPQRVVLFGGLTGSERIVSRVTERLRSHLVFAPDVVVSAFADEAPLVGAVTLAADAVPR